MTQVAEAGVRKLLDAGKIKGFAMATQRGDDRVDAAGGSSGKPGLQIDSDTLFEIGSVTKTFTGTLLADAVLRGDVALTDPINEFLPDDVRAPERKGKQIRFVDLATHSASLPPMPPNYKRLLPKRKGRLIGLVNPRRAVRDMFDHMAGLYGAFGSEQLPDALHESQLKYDIGTKAKYSNFSFGLLGDLLARIAGTSYADLVETRICKPLGMTDTFCVVPPDREGRLAQGHAIGGLPAKAWQIGGGVAAAGVIRSTVNDMMRYMLANVRPEASPLGDVFTLAQTPHFTVKPDKHMVGLGWQIMPPVTWHNGGTGGFGTYAGLRRDADAVVVVLSNSFHGIRRSVDRPGRAWLVAQS